MALSRRSFLSGLAAIAAPAVITTPGLLMPLRGIVPVPALLPSSWTNPGCVPPNTLLTINMITREAVQLFRNNNSFIQEIERQFAEHFSIEQLAAAAAARAALPEGLLIEDYDELNI